ncbi:MAG: hypothetical protein Q6367_011155, partial [Candidatus Freyarchaeota archaeon]
MIYGLLIFDRSGKNFFQKFYGIGNTIVEQKFVRQFVKDLIILTYSLNSKERIGCLDLENLKLFYKFSKDNASVLYTDQNEEIKSVKDKLLKVHQEFTKIL